MCKFSDTKLVAANKLYLQRLHDGERLPGVPTTVQRRVRQEVRGRTLSHRPKQKVSGAVENDDGSRETVLQSRGRERKEEQRHADKQESCKKPEVSNY